MKNFKMWSIIAGIALGIAIVIAFLVLQSGQPGQYDAFAKCLKDKDAVFYGAFWCPHCQNQKNMFGKSSKYLPYVECSTPDSRGQLKVCSDADIQGYPTWVFADASRESGEVSLEKLAEKTGCALPQ